MRSKEEIEKKYSELVNLLDRKYSSLELEKNNLRKNEILTSLFSLYTTIEEILVLAWVLEYTSKDITTKREDVLELIKMTIRKHI